MQTGLGARGRGVVEVDFGEVLVGEEVEGLEGTVGGEVLGGGGGGEHECSEEENGSEVVEAHVTCFQCKTWGGWRGRRGCLWSFGQGVFETVGVLAVRDVD